VSDVSFSKINPYPIDESLKYIYEWAKNLTEETSGLTELRSYCPTIPVKKLITRFMTPPSLTFLTGLQGVGKSTALAVIFYAMKDKCAVERVKWREGYGYSEFMRNGIENNTHLLIDLPDYSHNKKRAMTQDLTAIQRLWEFHGHKKSIIVALQKELAEGHYFLGKGAHIELIPLEPEDIVKAYLRMFEKSNIYRGGTRSTCV